MESDSVRHPYAGMAYAATLAHVGHPFDVPGWNAPVILRDVASHAGVRDAMGLHPMCVLESARDIGAGLDALRSMGLPAIVLVSDPLAPAGSTAGLGALGFRRPFKTHHVIDRAAGEPSPSKHHRERIRRARRHVSVQEVCLADPSWRRCWDRLYGGLVVHRGICGLHDFPSSSFDALAGLPSGEVAAFAASDAAGEVHAMQIWIVHADRAYSHLTATSAEGYRLLATYALYAAAIEALPRCRLLDLGGGFGNDDAEGSSLSAFKRGFANTERMAFLCGAVLIPSLCDFLSAGRDGPFFPAYRNPR